MNRLLEPLPGLANGCAGSGLKLRPGELLGKSVSGSDQDVTGSEDVLKALSLC